MEEVLISVVIPCFNHGRFLSPAFQSIDGLGYPKLEVIVVDDDSTGGIFCKG
jgi:glycosyltransferase involved in cell wall biosynthesis